MPEWLADRGTDEMETIPTNGCSYRAGTRPAPYGVVEDANMVGEIPITDAPFQTRRSGNSDTLLA